MTRGGVVCSPRRGPTIVVDVDGCCLLVELELTANSKPRLRAGLAAHANRVHRRSHALMFARSNQAETDRIEAAAAVHGLSIARGHLRIELVETLRAYAIKATAERRCSVRIPGVVPVCPDPSDARDILKPNGDL
jgi:hypothetical protein